MKAIAIAVSFIIASALIVTAFAKEPEVGEKVKKMALIPAGHFIMGNSDGYLDEAPQRKIYLDAFKLDITEVTNDEYRECVRSAKCLPNSKYSRFSERYQPVVGVNWFMARDYCAFMDKRLPSEAEWEKAARGTDGRKFPWGEKIIKELGAFKPRAGALRWDRGLRGAVSFSRGTTVNVGSFPKGAGPYGVLDMAGNAWEWTSDWYDPEFHSKSDKRNPKGPDTGKWKVLRGGAYYSPLGSVTTYGRFFDKPSARTTFIGFRCARDNK